MFCLTAFEDFLYRLPVGLTRIELVTSSLSGMRSNRLSYSPSRDARLAEGPSKPSTVAAQSSSTDQLEAVAEGRDGAPAWAADGGRLTT